jgi:quercetin dioxygenase-like cupin family protein
MKTVSFLADLEFASKPQIKVMHESSLGKEIRICMDKGNIMQEHTAPQAITIMIIKGSVRIASDGEEATLHEGDMLYFNAKVPHSLEAEEQSVVRLVLSKNDTTQRVQNLVKFKV